MRLDAYVKTLQVRRTHHHWLGRLISKRPDWAPGLKLPLRVVATRCLGPLAKQRASRLLRSGRLCLHLGCGSVYLKGWVNIDLLGTRGPLDLVWDLRRPMPFPDSSVDAVFHEHLLEHLPLTVALPFLQECRRVLRSGGILRVGVPDAGRCIKSVVEADGFNEGSGPGFPTPLLALSELAYRNGHRSLWDDQTLRVALEEAGLEQVSTHPYGKSRLEPAPDSPARAAVTLYVEGIRP